MKTKIVENLTARFRVFYLNEIRSISLSPGLNILSEQDYSLFKNLQTAQAAYDCGELKDSKVNEEKIEKSLDGIDVIRNSDGELVPVNGYSEASTVVNNPILENAAKEYEKTLIDPPTEETQSTNDFIAPTHKEIKGITDEDAIPTIRVTTELIKELQASGMKVTDVSKITKSQPAQGYTRKDLEEKLGDTKIDLDKYFPG